MAECVVYWLYDKNCKNIETDGYVGISVEPETRLIAHEKNERFNRPFCMEILKSATLNECRIIERQLRPKENIGWNIAAGGGRPPVQKNQKQIICDKCGKVSNPGNHKKWHGDNCGRRMSEEEKIYRSSIAKGKINVGKKHTPEHCDRMSKARKGKATYIRTPEQCAAISVRQRGKKRGPMSQETRNKIGNAHRGKVLGPQPPRSEDIKNRISSSLKGRKKSIEHITNVLKAKYNKKKTRFHLVSEKWKNLKRTLYNG